jgi:hypothetical protein
MNNQPRKIKLEANIKFNVYMLELIVPHIPCGEIECTMIKTKQPMGNLMLNSLSLEPSLYF